jgi:hypothetical protein
MRSGGMRVCLFATAAVVAGCGGSPTQPTDPTPPPSLGPTVRLVYAVPQDRAFRGDYPAAVTSAFADVRSWYASQLGGPTFTLFRADPDSCRLPEAADYYLTDTWTRVMNGVQACLPVAYDSPDFRWAIYADVEHECNAPGRIGAALRGVTILGSGDLEGLIGNTVVSDCGKVFNLPVERYIGGAAHELGHTFGLPHPPGCSEGLTSCEDACLMWLGYTLYPYTYLREEEKAVLRALPFFTGSTAPLESTSRRWRRTT